MQFDEQALDEVRKSRLLIDRFDDWLFEEFKPYVGQRILEIGCGLGNHFDHFLDRERLVGFDLSADSAAKVQKRFKQHPNVRVLAISITDSNVLTLCEERFDTVFSLNVFEHIDDDELALRHTHQLLQPGGALILIVPAHPWLYGPMDSAIGHYRRYTKSSLQSKLQKAGFEVVMQKYVNMLGGLGWFVNGGLLRRRVPPRGQLRLMNGVVPCLRFLEHLMPAPFGVSLLTVSKKKSLQMDRNVTSPFKIRAAL